MGGIVTADYVIGGKDDLTRQELDQIIQILDIRDPTTGQLVKPPVGQACLYKLVLEKSDQTIPTGTARKTRKKRKGGLKTRRKTKT